MSNEKLPGNRNSKTTKIQQSLVFFLLFKSYKTGSFREFIDLILAKRTVTLAAYAKRYCFHEVKT